jgi:hypothetical protein
MRIFVTKEIRARALSFPRGLPNFLLLSPASGANCSAFSCRAYERFPRTVFKNKKFLRRQGLVGKNNADGHEKTRKDVVSFCRIGKKAPNKNTLGAPYIL